MKSILITGARGGIIGDVINKIRYKYNIILTVHTYDELKMVKRIYKDFNNIKCYKLDMNNIYDIYKISEFKVDILICNSSVMESGSLMDLPLEKIRSCFDINFFNNILLIKRILKNNDNVKIIIMSSLGGLVPMPFCGVYSASKAAFRQLIRAFEKEVKLLSRKIDIVIIEPGLYNTGFNEYGFSKKYKYMDDSLFANKMELVKKIEFLLLKLFEKKNNITIVTKIVKAIDTESPHLFYRAPIFQTIFVKLYNFFD
ncbi:MAG: SDR family NAD(P)-dependent oxidoreductase [Bacilli bacterium]|nr:SDR family NAD(P)-dependent oxidoreductase [Bacilli bacterium]